MNKLSEHPAFMAPHDLLAAGNFIRFSLEFTRGAKETDKALLAKLRALERQVQVVRDGFVKLYEGLPVVRFNSPQDYRNEDGTYSLGTDLARLRDFTSHQAELPRGNHSLATILKKAGVCPAGCSFDPESSCLYAYFDTEDVATEFNRRLNLFLDAANKGDVKLSTIKVKGGEGRPSSARAKRTPGATP